MSDRLTDDELRALVDAVTPGRWTAHARDRSAEVRMPGRSGASAWLGNLDGRDNLADARIMAASPDLAQELLELRAEVATHRQQELADLMSGISEDYYCAGWLIGLEFSLWAMVQGGSRDFGIDAVSEDEVAELRRLSERCGGWIARGGESPVFMPMADWLNHYEAKATKVPA